MVKELVVLGKEIELPQDISEEEVSSNLISLVRDLAPEVAQELERTRYTTKVEGNALVVYRLDAIFG